MFTEKRRRKKERLCARRIFDLILCRGKSVSRRLQQWLLISVEEKRVMDKWILSDDDLSLAYLVTWNYAAFLSLIQYHRTGGNLSDVDWITTELHHPFNSIGRLLQLILGCAINCDDKQGYIESIMVMEESVQQVLMQAIQELMNMQVYVRSWKERTQLQIYSVIS